MKTVGEVMETIKEVRDMSKALQGKADEAGQEGKNHDADMFGDAAMMLGDYVLMLKRMKLEEEI